MTAYEQIETIIELQNVTKKYPNGFEALKNINLTIDSGEIVFLTGHSELSLTRSWRRFAGWKSNGIRRQDYEFTIFSSE